MAQIPGSQMPMRFRKQRADQQSKVHGLEGLWAFHGIHGSSAGLPISDESLGILCERCMGSSLLWPERGESAVTTTPFRGVGAIGTQSIRIQNGGFYLCILFFPLFLSAFNLAKGLPWVKPSLEDQGRVNSPQGLKSSFHPGVGDDCPLASTDNHTVRSSRCPVLHLWFHGQDQEGLGSRGRSGNVRSISHLRWPQ